MLFTSQLTSPFRISSFSKPNNWNIVDNTCKAEKKETAQEMYRHVSFCHRMGSWAVQSPGSSCHSYLSGPPSIPTFTTGVTPNRLLHKPLVSEEGAALGAPHCHGTGRLRNSFTPRRAPAAHSSASAADCAPVLQQIQHQPTDFSSLRAAVSLNSCLLV